MGFSLSPSVDFKELDLTTTVPAVATSIGGTVGNFAWGPVEQVTQVDSENTLVKRFGYPTDANYLDWFSAANFLGYTNNLQLVRVVGAAAKNAGDAAGHLIKNQDHFDLNETAIVASTNTFVAKYPGTFGNLIEVELADSTTFAAWAHKDEFEFAPTLATDLYVVVLYDGSVVERFIASTLTTSKDFNGNSNYAKELINRTSSYIWIVIDNLDTGTNGYSYPLTLGTDVAPSLGERQIGWDLLADPEAVDVNLIFNGGGLMANAQYVCSIATARKDCLAFVSPDYDDVVGVADPAADIIAAKAAAITAPDSYGVMDGNFKYQYDKYNDKYRWLPLNADIAGLCARTDDTNDPWWSPGGPNRGQIRNVTKLAFNPKKSFRDSLYKAQINPVVSFPGEGTMLYGDKTMQAKPSAFQAINVRRLFIVLEKAISTFARFSLFEFNDVFTRNRFVNSITPFLRNVQGRRGIIRFRVIADSSNNTADVIARREFVADIYIQPNIAINNITLNFVAIDGTVSFEELVG